MYLTDNIFTKQTPKYYEVRRQKYWLPYPHNNDKKYNYNNRCSINTTYFDLYRSSSGLLYNVRRFWFCVLYLFVHDNCW